MKLRPLLVYLSYPSDVNSSPPFWIRSLLDRASKDVFFYVSGSIPSTEIIDAIGDSVPESLPEFLSRVKGYVSRTHDALSSGCLPVLVERCVSSPLSTEYRVLLDLWMLSRADILVVDTDLLGRGHCGIQTLYAQGIIPTVGVSDSPVQDPWYQYHLDALVKSMSVHDHIEAYAALLLSRRYSKMLKAD